jgi:glucoamylase
LTTLAVAEQLYDALIVWNAQGKIDVTSTSLSFFQQFLSTATVGTYPSTSTAFTTITSGVKAYADGFVNVVAKYTPSGGALSEQYTRAAGVPTSASDLTWSYAAAITAFRARSGWTPKSWGAANFTVPTTCSTSGGGGGGGSGTVAVSFNVNAQTVWGGESFSVDLKRASR